MRRLALTVVCVLLVPSLLAQGGGGQDPFTYRGADRDARLLDRAKREGRVSVYTSLAPTESGPLAQAFEKKYGIRVDLWRALSDQVVQRTLTEARAKRFAVDVVETNGPQMEVLTRERVLVPFYSPHVADLPPAVVPAHRSWFPDRLNFFVVAFNTTRVKRSEIPATYEGFTDPKWRGRIALESTDTEWMATIVKSWGEAKGMAFFRALAALKPEVRTGHVMMTSLIAAGEVPVGLGMYSSNVIPLKRKGAPIDFVPVQPVVARPQGIGVVRLAPHPNAAVLFADFVLSPQGQALFDSMGRAPASTRVKSGLETFPFTMVDMTAVLDESQKWEELWRELFLRR